MEKQKPLYIDLFCGAGGFSLGFEQAGYENVLAVDYDRHSCNTYRHNFPSHHLLEKDIRGINKPELSEIIGKRKVHAIIGGPPCQGFSLAGNIGRKSDKDPRNSLFHEFARIVGIVRPEYFIMENVARIYSHDKGKTRNAIIRTFNDMGYAVECRILNAADFGVPQIRCRCIFIGSKRLAIRFPKRNAFPHMTVREAISDLPKLLSGESSDIPNHKAMNHTPHMLERMSYVKDGGNRTQIPVYLRPTSGDARKYIRYASNRPSVCITGDMRKVFHYSQNRALTVRELARIQSFPDAFFFHGTSISQQQQVGNAVPQLLARRIAKVILPQAFNGLNKLRLGIQGCLEL